MPRPILRRTFSAGLALCLSLVFTPLACGGSYQGSVEPARPAARVADEAPQVPPGTFSAMMACVTEAKGRLTERGYALQFDIEVSERGEASRVKLRDAYPSEDALSACLGHALEGMTLPASVLRRIPKQKAASPASRGLMGQVWEEVLLIGAGTSVGPILLTAAGVTVIVVAGVYVTAEAIDAVRRRRKRREKCLGMFVRCQDIGGVCTRRNRRDGLDICGLCRDDCDAPKSYTRSECYQCGFYDP